MACDSNTVLVPRDILLLGPDVHLVLVSIRASSHEAEEAYSCCEVNQIIWLWIGCKY